MYFFKRILSYFAKPHFLIYDEWFDDDLEKTKLDIKNKKLKTISNLHDFFYEQSIYKIGASEKHMQLDIKVNKKELITYDHSENSEEKYSSVTNKKFSLFERLIESRLKFNITKKLIYPLSIFGFIFIFGFLIFFISQSKKNNSTITEKLLVLEKNF